MKTEGAFSIWRVDRWTNVRADGRRTARHQISSADYVNSDAKNLTKVSVPGHLKGLKISTFPSIIYNAWCMARATSLEGEKHEFSGQTQGYYIFQDVVKRSLTPLKDYSGATKQKKKKKEKKAHMMNLCRVIVRARFVLRKGGQTDIPLRPYRWRGNYCIAVAQRRASFSHSNWFILHSKCRPKSNPFEQHLINSEKLDPHGLYK